MPPLHEKFWVWPNCLASRMKNNNPQFVPDAGSKLKTLWMHYSAPGRSEELWIQHLWEVLCHYFGFSTFWEVLCHFRGHASDHMQVFMADEINVQVFWIFTLTLWGVRRKKALGMLEDAGFHFASVSKCPVLEKWVGRCSLHLHRSPCFWSIQT